MNSHYSFNFTVIFGVFIHLAFITAGILLFGFYNKRPVFYEKGKFSAIVLEILQEKPNSFQSVLEINAFFRNDSVFRTKEKVMVYFAKSKESEHLKPGEIINFNPSPQWVKNSNNPYEFDYKSYLSRRKIYRQVFLPSDSWVKTGYSTFHSSEVCAEKVRLKLLEIYRQQIPDEEKMNVLSALTLGYKRGLEPETKRVFASAGAMHVLAVSGLHVGIVYLVFLYAFGFLKSQKAGRLIFVLLVVSALWCFAFVTGLSPSVKRAATMFTFVVAGEGIRRRSNIYNTLAASAFILLLFNPNNLFEAGFQLSYSAVFGIVFLQPRFEKLITFKYKIPRYCWSLITVSVAAQIATFPVSVFYFNQFPVYFWISNLLVIPAVTLLIPLGILLLLFDWISVVSNVFSTIIEHVLSVVIQFLRFVENIPLSVVELTFTRVELAFVLGVLFSVLLFIETRYRLYFKGALIFFLLLLTTSLSSKIFQIFHKEIIVYNQSEQSVIHLISGKMNYIISEQKIPETGMIINSIENTVRTLKLNSPVFLTAEQVYRDSFLYLKNGMFMFEGRIAGLGEFTSPESTMPEFIIGPYTGKHFESLHSDHLIIVSTLRFPPTGFNDTAVFYLTQNGAFREKW